MVDKSRVNPFCKRGNDTRITGTDGVKTCRACKREKYKFQAATDPVFKEINRFRARNGHQRRLDEKATKPRPLFCEICDRNVKLYFDHCHSSDRFRGWICRECNSGLGFARDDPTILLRMIVYLENNK